MKYILNIRKGRSRGYHRILNLSSFLVRYKIGKELVTPLDLSIHSEIVNQLKIQINIQIKE